MTPASRPSREQVREPLGRPVEIDDLAGGLATMYGLPSAAAWSIRRRQSSRTWAYSSPSAVIQPCSAITLTTFRPASARLAFSSASVPPAFRYRSISSFQGSIAW